MSQHGAAVVSTKSGGGVTGSIRAEGGVKADYSSTQVTGTRVESRQNLAGSAATKDFTEGRSTDAGTAATMIAIGRDGIHETAGIVGDVATVARPLSSSMERSTQARETAERATQQAERAAEGRVQQNLQRTGKILQNQSRTSPLPKGGGPQPLKGPRR